MDRHLNGRRILISFVDSEAVGLFSKKLRVKDFKYLISTVKKCKK